MKVVCIKDNGHLSVNKIYDAKKVKKKSSSICENKIYSYLIKNDRDIEDYAPIENFLTLEEFREQQINQILK